MSFGIMSYPPSCTRCFF